MRVSARMFARGGWHTVAIVLWGLWVTTFATLVVLWYAPRGDDATRVLAFWQTGVFLAATLPLLVVFSRWTFRRERRLGPREEPVEDAEDAAAKRPHLGLHGDEPPPPRW